MEDSNSTTTVSSGLPSEGMKRIKLTQGNSHYLCDKPWWKELIHMWHRSNYDWIFSL